MNIIKNSFANSETTKNYTMFRQSGLIGKSHDKNNNGFTIIEVALVLAIAGLIFLVVFLALPALQNSQKDTARRQDVGRVVSALQSYEADNGGGLPNASSGWLTYSADGSNTSGFGGYLGRFGSEINGVNLISTSEDANIGWMGPPDKQIEVYPGEVCPNSTRTATSSDAAVGVVLSSGKVYCADM